MGRVHRHLGREPPGDQPPRFLAQGAGVTSIGRLRPLDLPWKAAVNAWLTKAEDADEGPAGGRGLCSATDLREVTGTSARRSSLGSLPVRFPFQRDSQHSSRGLSLKPPFWKMPLGPTRPRPPTPK